MAQNLLRLRRTASTIHRVLSASASLSSSIPRSSPFSSSAVTQSPPTFQIRFQSRSFRWSSVSFARPNSSAGNYNQNEEIGPDTILFEGCDYNHWLIVMDFPRDNKPPAEEMIRTYEETCAKGLNISVEEAKKKIYACSTTTYTGFQVLMSEEESEKFNDVPGVIFVLPDSYIDPQNKEYGGDKYDNGVITHRPPPFQYERQGSRYRDRNRYDRNQQGNSSFGQPGSPQVGGNYRAQQPGSPQQTYVPPGQTYVPPGQGENRGHASVNSPGGRDAYQPGRDTIPSYQGNYNQSPQRNAQGGQSTYTPIQGPTAGSFGRGPSSGSYGQGPSAGSYGPVPNAGTYRQGPSAGAYGQGPNAGAYGQGPNAGAYGQGPNAGAYGPGPNAGAYGPGPNAGAYGPGPNAGAYGPGPNAGPSAGTYGQGPNGGAYGQGPSAGAYGQGPSPGAYGQGSSAGRYAQGPSAGSYGQGPVAGGYGQGPVAGGYGQGPVAGGYGEGPRAGAHVQGPSSGYPASGHQSISQGEPTNMQGEQTNYTPMGQTGTDRGRQ